MKNHTLALVLAATALLAGGCLPHEFIWWSPDGQTAAVRTEEGLRLAGTNGQLSAVVLPGEIQSAAWLPDGSGLVVSRTWKAKDWAAAEQVIPPDEAATTRQMAGAVPDLLKSALIASGGSWDKVEEKFLKPLGMTESAALESAWSCALNLHRAAIVAVLASFTNAATVQAEVLSEATNGIPIHELSLLRLRNGQPAGETQALARSLRPLLDPIVSPRHAVLAFRTGSGALKAMTLEGQNPLVVVGEDVSYAVWSADGRALYHIDLGKSDKVGEIRSRTVVGDNGKLLPGGSQAKTLAMAAFGPGTAPRLAVLPDGRLLFASVPIALPAREAAINPGAQLFLLDPAKPDAAPVPVAVKEGSLPDDLNAFAASPDGRFVAVVEGGTDTVAVLELATGKANIISPPHTGWKSRMIPAWRNPRELSFAALPAATAARPELILWQAGALERILSKTWPDNVVKPWLEAPRGGGDKPAK
jgi:hypothetical protein